MYRKVDKINLHHKPIQFFYLHRNQSKDQTFRVRGLFQTYVESLRAETFKTSQMGIGTIFLGSNERPTVLLPVLGGHVSWIKA